MNKKYWDNYYLNHCRTMPSDFALISLQSMNRSSVVLDVGCGDGLDSRLFHQHGMEVYGIDESEESIRLCLSKEPNGNYYQSPVEGNHVFFTPVTYFFMRMFLHAITMEEEIKLFKWIEHCRNSLSYIYIETRTIHDEEVLSSGHSRRFINPDFFLSRIIALGWTVVSSIESKNFSVVTGENPLLWRVVLRKDK